MPVASRNRSKPEVQSDDQGVEHDKRIAAMSDSIPSWLTIQGDSLKDAK